MAISVLTAPAAEPVTVEDARKHCRIDADIDEFDWLLELLIQSAREVAEHETGRALIDRQLRLVSPVACRIEVRPCPVKSIDAVALIAEDGTATVLANADYRLDTTNLIPVLHIKAALGSAVSVRTDFTAGYGVAPEAVPAAIRRWIFMHVSTHFENREAVMVGSAVTAMPTPFIDGQLDPFRLHPGF